MTRCEDVRQFGKVNLALRPPTKGWLGGADSRATETSHQRAGKTHRTTCVVAGSDWPGPSATSCCPTTWLRGLRLLDPDCERLVYRIPADGDEAVLSATDEDLDELVGYVAAAANHEPNRRRQRRLDAVSDALDNATHAGAGDAM